MSRRLGILLLAVATALAACGGSPEPVEDVIEVFGPWRGEDAARFRAVLDTFETRTGFEVRYVGTTSYASQLRQRSAEASLPDVAIVPQPGLVADLVADGQVTPLAPTTAARVAEHQAPEIAALGRVGDAAVGVPVRLAMKSLVWYSPSALDALDGDVPATLGELRLLTRRVRGLDQTPWCHTIEALGSTGYIVSDWMEELLLRLGGPEVYDAALGLELPLDGPEVRAALGWYAEELLEPGASAGGLSRVLTVGVERAMDPMFAVPPRCLLHRQANSFRGELPAGTTTGPEGAVEVFALPDDVDGPAPLLLGGDMAVAFDDRPRVRELVDFLAAPGSFGSWVEAGGYLSPARDVRPADYPDPFDRAVARRLADAEVVRFDLSDSWPAAFGSGLVWDVLTRFTAGELTLDETLDELEAGRQTLVAEGRAPAPGSRSGEG